MRRFSYKDAMCRQKPCTIKRNSNLTEAVKASEYFILLKKKKKAELDRQNDRRQNKSKSQKNGKKH